MMIVLSALLAFAPGAWAFNGVRPKRPVFKHVCADPAELEGEMLHPQGVGLFEGPPSLLVSLKPDNGDSPDETAVWTGLEAKVTYWLACEYGGGKHVPKKIPRGVTRCEALKKGFGVACYKR